MLLDFKDEIPYLRTTFGILKAKGVVHAVQFGPNNQRIYRKTHIRTKSHEIRELALNHAKWEPDPKPRSLESYTHLVGAGKRRWSGSWLSK